MSRTKFITGLLSTHPALEIRARELAHHYSLVRLRHAPVSGYFLQLKNEGLELNCMDKKDNGPVRVDFVGGTLGHRLRFGGGRGQPLARAIGIKPGFDPSVWDATAGLGRDAFVLASLGCRVTLCERSPVLAALLDDGLKRAALNAEIGAWIESRMMLEFDDSTVALANLPDADKPDTVYLDPMYPAGKSSVLVKKNIRAVQQLAGEDRDSLPLLDMALTVAKRRVVVKRPHRAGPLHDRKPDTSIESKKTRYDIYVTL
ncbi:16S rRNA (guanine1516-N2)-methyltransferase [Thiogranum longum]|uniref:Ribosomal RNA small subunit methyltransferase J n=1 Tax=Thiogranum longum TaxID=1537524 RepID=A0A4R1HCI1_9GAMM|nr:class I SAM-dependent methyltransferase [Thiogranum longum]TCK16929.1 16S rRNA (guanine1516-N2)-methyltransferase [Thiogranum longum]